jgi:ribosomal 30S subunit maturation factor RimM
MEKIDIVLTKEKLVSEICYLKSLTKNSHLIIKSKLELNHNMLLNFKSTNGREVKNELNNYGLNRRISIPSWAGMFYIEFEKIDKNHIISVNVAY